MNAKNHSFRKTTAATSKGTMINPRETLDHILFNAAARVEQKKLFRVLAKKAADRENDPG